MAGAFSGSRFFFAESLGNAQSHEDTKDRFLMSLGIIGKELISVVNALR
jgi:hypothetical protein